MPEIFQPLEHAKLPKSLLKSFHSFVQLDILEARGVDVSWMKVLKASWLEKISQEEAEDESPALKAVWAEKLALEVEEKAQGG